MRSTAASLAALVLLCGAAPLLAVDTVPLEKVVAPYMGDGLELAVIPWPREASLAKRCLVASRLRVAAPDKYPSAFTLQDARRFAALLDEAAGKPATGAVVPLLLGELGDGGPADRAVARLGLSPSARKRAEMGEQGYVLHVGALPGHEAGAIVLAGVGPAGTFHGLQSLKQLVVVRGGKVHVRMGHLVDWPAMIWRGSKRPLAWEELYKANFGALPHATPQQNRDRFRIFSSAGADPQRGPKSWELEALARNPRGFRTRSRGLDASDAFIDWLFKGWEQEHRRTGNTLFMLKGDDIELALDEKSGTRKKFGDNVGAAFVYLLDQLDRRLKKLSPKCVLYWMPNPYYTTDWDFERLSRQVRAAGGLPSNIGLWWTGHWVFSERMTGKDIRGYQEAFHGKNPIKVKGLIYDNHGRAAEPSGRAADLFAMPRRDPAIARHLNGLANERGSWVNRITSYDFQWNPAAYDPKRSLELAVRELANRDPVYYRRLLSFCQAWTQGRYPSAKETSHALVVKQQRAFLADLEKRAPALKAAGEKALASTRKSWDGPAGDFRKEFLGQVLANVAFKKDMLAWIDLMWRDGTAGAYLIRAAEAPTIDGKLDEAIYRKKPTLDRFVTTGARLVDPKVSKKDPKHLLWEVPRGPVPAEASTQGWLFADDRNLYLAFRCNDRPYARPPGVALPAPRKLDRVGNDHPYNWRQASVSINLDVRHDRTNGFLVIIDALGQVSDEYLGWPGDPLPTGPAWSMGSRVKVVRDGHNWVVEAAIPLEKFGLKAVRRGDVWGVNAMRTGLNFNSFFSALRDAGPYGFRYPPLFGQVRWE